MARPLQLKLAWLDMQAAGVPTPERYLDKVHTGEIWVGPCED